MGLRPLLNRVGRDGHVYAVDLSQTMVARAQSRFAEDVEAGRLVLHAGDLAALPLHDQSVDAAITVNTVTWSTTSNERSPSSPVCSGPLADSSWG